MTAEKFLNRLPKCVIRQGEVVDIRGPIRHTLQVRPTLAPPASLSLFLKTRFSFYFFKLILERGRETSINCLQHAPHLRHTGQGTWPSLPQECFVWRPKLGGSLRRV